MSEYSQLPGRVLTTINANMETLALSQHVYISNCFDMHGLLNVESTVPFVDALDFCTPLKRDGIHRSEETTQLTCTIMWDFVRMLGTAAWHLDHISALLI